MLFRSSLFETLLNNLKHEVIRVLSHVQVQREDEAALIEQRRREEQARERLAFQHQQASAMNEQDQEPEAQPQQPLVREGRKIGRNVPCPCGSGKKYKQCHGKIGA
mgnify:CR=1 FL=1